MHLPAQCAVTLGVFDLDVWTKALASTRKIVNATPVLWPRPRIQGVSVGPQSSDEILKLDTPLLGHKGSRARDEERQLGIRRFGALNCYKQALCGAKSLDRRKGMELLNLTF